MIEITKREYRAKKLEEILSDDNLMRKNKTIREYDFYKNNHQSYVYSQMCKEYGEKTMKDFRQIFSINVTRKIVNDWASIYKHKPTRTFQESSDAEKEQLKNLYKLGNLDRAFKKQNRMFKLLKHATLMVVPKGDRIKPRVLLPHQYDVITDPSDASTPLVYIISTPTDKNTEREDMRFVWWSKDFNFTTDGNGSLIEEIIDNPIGELPFVEASEERDGCYWVTDGNSIVDFAEDLMKLLSDTANVSRLQGFAQAVIYAEKAPNEFTMGATKVLHLPINEDSKKDPKFEFVSPSPDLAATLKLIEQYVSLFLTTNDIDPKSINSSGSSNTYSSGIERLLSMIESFEASQDDIDEFLDVEERTYGLLKLWSNVFQGTTDGLDARLNKAQITDKVQLGVEYHKPQMIETKKEKLAFIREQVDLGVMSKVEAIMEIRNVNKEEAEEILNMITPATPPPL